MLRAAASVREEAGTDSVSGEASSLISDTRRQRKPCASTGRTVLVIDDEVHVRRVVELKFRNAGYRVIGADNGEDGLRLVQSEQPDAVISDIMMPGLDGKTLCTTTDHLKAVRPFLTVVITGRISADEQEWINRMRETVFMEKPFSPSRLLGCVDNYFGIVR
jgi:DNA-binding response OmpR family regulator